MKGTNRWTYEFIFDNYAYDTSETMFKNKSEDLVKIMKKILVRISE
jgi:hypothetical protein